ncbi:RsmD family RNA methyltransferase [Candidatus Saccharibacteria bacterium]|nr:RsmD family RNA methyltransferase [Candidatus Saccharibacteria bacterium]
MKDAIKITSGIYRGRTLLSPRDSHTHPMGSRERLALMNTLGPDILTGAVVLDAFAGTGALGLEALSRGAKSVVFVEQNPHAAHSIRRNLKFLKLINPDEQTSETSPVKLVEQSVEGYCKAQIAAGSTGQFTLIIADPPYHQIAKKSLRPLLNLLAPGGYLALSHPAGFDPTSVGNGEMPVELISNKRYAAANISILRKKC